MSHALPNLPCLLYVGDVPVESSYHGSALLYRLLQTYPTDCLRIIESGLAASLQDRRLPDVPYLTALQPSRRWLHTRFHRLVSSVLALWAKSRLGVIERAICGFKAESILTVAHGYSWLTAAELARRRQLPLHMIVHDDCPRVLRSFRPVQGWVEQQFSHCYRQATSRLCVSPYMIEEYQRRYGVSGQLLYPSHAAGAVQFSGSPGRLREDHPLTCVFGGTINSSGYLQALKTLAGELALLGGRLVLYGPLSPERATACGLNASNIEVRGLVSSQELIQRCREMADVLFVPMSFDPQDEANMRIGFPSKLTDYTALGLPLLIYGPAYCSAVRWAREHPGVAEVVDAENSKRLGHALRRLAGDPQHRMSLGARALEVGNRCFAHSVVTDQFQRALAGAGSPAGIWTHLVR